MKNDPDYSHVYPSGLDNMSKNMTSIKHRVGGYHPKLITQNSGGSPSGGRRKGSAKSYLNG